MKTLYQEILKACRRADYVLWDAYVRSSESQHGASGAGKLIFPKYHGKHRDSLRVSEQEARFAFVEALSQGSLVFSVEAPTSKTYQFTGKKPLSAQTDLAIYDGDGIRICNVEFKSKGVSPSAQKHFPIYKDLQKLLREPHWGLWFHLLKSCDNSTINNLLTVMARQTEEVCRKFKDVESPGLSFHICVLQHRFSLHRDVPLPPFCSTTSAELGEFLRVDLKISRSDLDDVRDLNGWSLHRHQVRSNSRRFE